MDVHPTKNVSIGIDPYPDHHADTVSNVVQPPSGHETWHAGNPFDDFPMEFSESHGFFTGGCLGE